MGVTVFFVLSGFLITRLLTNEHEQTGRVNFRAFYGRRVRRLLPALVVLLLIDGIVRYLHGLSLVTVAAAAANASNIAAAMFQVPLDELSHMWSLSLEEQFYLLWPALLLLLVRTRFAVPTIAVAVVASAGWRGGLMVAGASASRIGNGPDTRVDALLVGCLLALVVHRVRRPGRGVAAVSAVVLGACCLLGEMEILWALLPVAVCAAIVVAWSLDHHGWLSCRPLVFVGCISYGLYLWHNPVALLIYDRFGAAGAPITFAITFGLAIPSWYIVERPFMRRTARAATNTFTEVVAPTAEVRSL